MKRVRDNNIIFSRVEQDRQADRSGVNEGATEQQGKYHISADEPDSLRGKRKREGGAENGGRGGVGGERTGNLLHFGKREEKDLHIIENSGGLSGSRVLPLTTTAAAAAATTTEVGDESDDPDDEVGHIHARAGDMIDGRYKVMHESGRGTFGKVLFCEDTLAPPSRPRLVAIKVVRSIPRYVESAEIESDILKHVNLADESLKVPIVRLYSSFRWNGHFCMVMEPLGDSLYDLVKANNYRALPLYCVQSFADQLVQAVVFMHEIGLVHTDLKLENILLISREGFHKVEKPTSERPNALTLAPRGSTQIKIIDFGGATYTHEHKSSLINTRQYRAPEVILGLGWSLPSDIWSVGCILLELYTGELLFDTHDSAEHLLLMEKIIGHFPKHIVKIATEGHSESKYFSHGLVRVPSRLPRESLRKVQDQRSLREIVNEKDTVFLDLVMGMLALDPAERITAREALNHRFFTSVRKRMEVPTPQVYQKVQPSKLQRASHERPLSSRGNGSSQAVNYGGSTSGGRNSDHRTTTSSEKSAVAAAQTFSSSSSSSSSSYSSAGNVRVLPPPFQPKQLATKIPTNSLESITLSSAATVSTAAAAAVASSASTAPPTISASDNSVSSFHYSPLVAKRALNDTTTTEADAYVRDSKKPILPQSVSDKPIRGDVDVKSTPKPLETKELPLPAKPTAATSSATFGQSYSYSTGEDKGKTTVYVSDSSSAGTPSVVTNLVQQASSLERLWVKPIGIVPPQLPPPPPPGSLASSLPLLSPHSSGLLSFISSGKDVASSSILPRTSLLALNSDRA